MSSQNELQKSRVNVKTQEITNNSIDAVTVPADQNIFRKNVQTIWKIIFIAVLTLSAILVKKLYIFHTHEHFNSIVKMSVFGFLKYSLPFAIIFTILDLIIHQVFDPFFQKHYITEERYKEPENKKKRCYTLVKWAYSIIYYLISSIWAYKIISNTTFLPTWLGGLGTQFYLVAKIDMTSIITFQMQIFYFLQAGKHFSRFFSHVFIRPEGAFFQYALHHGLSIFLIIFSCMSYQWFIGIFVLLLHDFSDFGLITARTYKDYKHASKFVLDILSVNTFVSWVSCRIILFSYYCIYSSILSIPELYKYDPFFTETFEFVYFFMVAMMIFLEVLHLYWTYYILESFIAIKISSKLAKHSYD